jgi:hypothetical protein
LIPKDIAYRNRKLLDLAHRIDECQVCFRYTEGCEPAHSDYAEHGKGMQRKAHDCFFAAMCHDCHRENGQGKGSAEERFDVWRRAADRTWLICWRNGWIKVAA